MLSAKIGTRHPAETMNGWPVHSESNGFPSEGAFDPSSMINNTPNAQYNNPQYQQARSQTPSQFPYTPTQLVPSKRPRDESGGGAVNSPRQAPSHVGSLSRSQTPQQASNFTGGGGGFPNGQQPGQPLPNNFQHLQQHGSNNATPSPTLSNQQFRPQTQQPGMAHSPPPDGSGRGTPQNLNQPQFNMNGQIGAQQMGGAQMGMGGQMQGQNFNMPATSVPQGYNQNYANMQNMASQGGAFPGVQLTANLASQQAAIQRIGVERQRQMMQQRQGGMNPMMQQAVANPSNMGTPTRPQGNMPGMQNPQRAAEERAFMDKVAKYMQHAQQSFNPHPTLAGRPVNLYVLFQLILRSGSSKQVTQANQWPILARNLGIPPEQYPSAGHELQQIFHSNLGRWEAAYWNSQQQRMAQMKQAQMASMAQGQQSMSPARGLPGQSPQANNQPQNQAYMAQLQAQARMASVQAQQSPAPVHMTPHQANASLPITNGLSTPQTDPASARAPSLIEQHRKSASRQLDGSPAQTKANTIATPPPKTLATIETKERDGHYRPYMLPPRFYGGQELDKVADRVGVIPRHDMDIPGPLDIGVLDIQALTLSLQSGIAAEVRYALDILAKVTHNPTFVRVYYIDLRECGDLLDVLIDCGEDQVDFLSDESKRIEGLEHGSYEEIARLAKVELQEIQDVPEIGSKRYHHERAADRLVTIASILRNFSFPHPQAHQYQDGDARIPDNARVLAESRAIKFLSHAIGLLATRVVSLYSSINTQDFMKDIIIFLSNTARHVILESQDDAYHLLQFLLAFAPGPIPTETNPFRFASYKPSVHKYYPHAIDAFAKLLARHDSNRPFFKQIFVDSTDHEDAEESDLPVHQQYDLLTRAFGMAVAVIPDVSGHERKPLNRMDDELMEIARERKASISQGMLIADLLSTLIPASDPSLAKAWLRSQDSWGCVLFRVVSELAEHDGMMEVAARNKHGGHVPPHIQQDDHYQAQFYTSIVSRAMSMLKRLARKALEDTSQAVQPPTTEDAEQAKVNGVEHHEADDAHQTPTKETDEALLDSLADLEQSPAADFLPLSEAIFNGIFANTKELTSGVIADYIALGEILR